MGEAEVEGGSNCTINYTSTLFSEKLTEEDEKLTLKKKSNLFGIVQLIYYTISHEHRLFK